MTIRTATLDDVTELSRHPSIPGLLTCEHETLIADADVLFWIAVLDGTICGHVNARMTGFRTKEFMAAFPATPTLNGLAVWPENLRNAGIGTALVQTVESAAASKGVERVGLGIYADNDAARRFYERLGYVDWGQGAIADRTGEINPGVIAMTKQL